MLNSANKTWELASAFALALLALPLSAAEPKSQVFYGVKVEQLEYRFNEIGEKNDAESWAWDGDAFIGTDELKLRLQSEGEYIAGEDVFETLENKVVLQIPVSTFFDAKAGVRFDTPEGPDRTYAVLGLQGLAPQWFEVDADLFVSEKGDVSVRLDVDYELLITNRVILTPTAEINAAFSDDREIGVGSGLSSAELGLRLSYDLLDRSIAPYIGVHYERLFGNTADFAKDEGEDDDELFVVAGVRLLF